MRHIDLKSILQRTVSGVYGDLVTRPTGKAVRTGIEAVLAEADGDEVALIDFSTVRCLDISCADEIVGTLLRERGTARYFVLHGVTPSHCDAIEHVLERHGVAVAARDRSGRIRVLGPVDETAQRTFAALRDNGPAPPRELALRLALPEDQVHKALELLRTQGLVQRHVNGYATLTE